MNQEPTKLGDIQAWMQEMLVSSGRDTATTEQHIEPSPTLSLSATERLAIYQRGYYARLVQCMEGQFKALCHALGKPLFDDFAREYLGQFPSGSPTLAVLGEKFPDYLEQTRPDRDSPEKETWVDFMIDLARFEWDLYRSFDAPGHEGKPYATADTPDELLQLQPCFFLHAYRFPVSAYYEGVARKEDPEFPPELPHYVAIVRKDFRIGIHVLTEVQYRFLKNLQLGQNLKDTLHQASSGINQESDILKDWPDWKKKWTMAGFFL